MRPSLRTGGIALAVVALVVGVVGCSAEQGTPVPASTPSPSAAPSGLAQPAPTDFEQAVRGTLEAYRQALVDRDGMAAVSLVSADTIDYYQQLATVAGTGGPEEIGARPLVDRLTIALLRVRRPPAELATLDGRALFAYSVEAGLIDAATIADNQLGSVRIDGDRAFGQVVVRGQPTPVDYEFVQVGDDWKFDIVPTLALVNTALQRVVAQMGVSEDEFIFRTVESATGQRIDSSIFARP